MGKYSLLDHTISKLDELKFASMGLGAQFVTISGTIQMPVLYADIWDIRQMVS